MNKEELVARAVMLMRGSMILRQADMVPGAVAVAASAEQPGDGYICIVAKVIYPDTATRMLSCNVGVSKNLVIEGSMGHAANAVLFKINLERQRILKGGDA